ncbi:pyrroloquinoline-quinone synthase PqqC [Granulibacter bethesdensis]|uniref:Pyrroloquinoline-quinone synthase n=1 Tax=Granulibacter bethesdensis (strain ATCC BAA-1260 / CGDNIH1) TaxID=391165 RepID=PQQC_GRABC|nr:pyrroloquinoline-quinone synthase PqqC [Granulibacter bethesdensis]Q0BQS6.1 RecName: Full=Pyrroloquinoline-quinone synthase; AltName: Full=Coenzyme PQQ synthesis protein C; AltName: Full=Pyrroloquinoline quinone biosynthesis protein C [Granulibacter bethesdensis CGDNIH1]ABI62826.1 Coenzyme PQQ synthesis protein C [Granulibacter bethesdensis CGDNIH1]AHJ68222.1 Coenzyme PQQ synthesis protein C [Granulibacter bethesdensis]APH52690.1 Coenzyme PQQ synthesis protein C [Granulibacter bethesdensis]
MTQLHNRTAGQETNRVMTPDELEAALRAVGAERYHNLHPFHRLLHDGALTRGQVQAWALNRYHYQASIPAKDAALLSRLPTAELRREWRRRLVDHDGTEPGTGGIARWLKLAEGVGLDAAYVESREGLLPTTRFAVDAYVTFCREKPILEAIASSLTEMFSPTIIRERVSGMLANYDWVSEETLAYFKPRLTQAPRDVDFALAYVKEHARTPEQQQAVIAALRFKCDVLWSQLDALYYSYVAPGNIPPGAFVPEV